MPVTTAIDKTLGDILTEANCDQIDSNFAALDKTTAKGSLVAAASSSSLGELAVGTDWTFPMAKASGAVGLAYQAALPMVAHDQTLIELLNTVVETTLLTFAVPANSLYVASANRGYIGKFQCGSYNAVGGGVTLDLKQKYGTETIANCTATLNNLPSGYAPVEITVWLWANGATNAQCGAITVLGMQEVLQYAYVGSKTEDSTTALNLVLTGTLNAASASLAFRKYMHQLYYLY